MNTGGGGEPRTALGERGGERGNGGCCWGYLMGEIGGRGLMERWKWGGIVLDGEERREGRGGV